MAKNVKDGAPHLRLEDGSPVAVIGGGPSGSFASYFLLDLAERAGLDIEVDLYEPQDFSRIGPAGCNHCGGIVSESLVQLLATEGINLPPEVVQRGIDSYMLHMDVGSVRIDTPLREKRIASIFRGGGPLGTTGSTWKSFDGFLLELTQRKGARIIRERVDSVRSNGGRPLVKTKGGAFKEYDLVMGAVGVNAAALKLFQDMEFGYRPPRTTKTFICEFFLGSEMIRRYLGSSMHVFLLNIPRLQFAALIPKGNFATLCLLGEEIDKELVESFLAAPELKQCFPPGVNPSRDLPCKCYPKINVRAADLPFADRVLLLGDCAVTRLYKDGIGAAYTSAKAAASTAVLHGVSAEDFKSHYWPACRHIENDNTIGKLIFAVTSQIQKRNFTKRGVLGMVSRERQKESNLRHMSTVLWDTFTGSAPYRDIFVRTLYPAFLTHLLWELVLAVRPFRKRGNIAEDIMETTTLGRVYQDGESILTQGEMGDCMYVIQSGKVEVIRGQGEREIILTELGEGDFFGEMALFEREVRSTNVRAKGETKVLTVDRKTLLRKIQEDPSLAFRMLENMCSRVRKSDALVTRVQVKDRRNWATRRAD